jgi:hypothetical protein
MNLLFNNPTWMGTGISFFIIVISAYVINRLTNKGNYGNSQNSLSFLTIFFIGVLTSQGELANSLVNLINGFRIEK